jgi:chemotaxis methyl-accepting protein methylase
VVPPDPAPRAPPIVPEEGAALDAVLAHVRRAHGVDFTGYRPATVLRRLRNRMIAVNEPSVAAYLSRLARDEDESAALVSGVTLKVSRFFRCAHVFDALARELERRLARRPSRALAIWSAGVGRGEEPYGLAALLDELGAAPAAGVLATDVDPRALTAVVLGRYPAAALVEVPAARRARHLRAVGARGACWEVRPSLRRRVRCARHDLTAGEAPPGGPFDLVSCRNVLIYLRPEVQGRVQRLLRDATAPGGLLCLGEAEWLAPEVAPDFEIVDRRAHLFARRGGEGTS